MYLSTLPVANPVQASQAALGNIMSATTALPMQQAMLSQQQTAANFAPQLAYAQTQEALGHANLYNDLGNYRTTQAGVLNSGGNNPLAQLQRISQTALMTGNYDAYMAAQQAQNNYLAQQQATIQKNIGQGAQAQAGAAKSSAEAVNLGGSGGYVSPQLPIVNPTGIVTPASFNAPSQSTPPMVSTSNTITPNSITSAPNPATGLTPQGNSPGIMQNLQNGLQTAYQQQFGSQAPGSPQGAAATQQAQQPQSVPQGNFMDWQPQQRSQYIQNNDRVPPMYGIPRMTDIDAKTRTKIDSLAPTAQSLVFVKEGLQNPQITQFLGENGPAMLRKAQANATRLGTPDPALSEYYAWKSNVKSFVADSIATGQTGSRAAPVIQMFQDVFNPDTQISSAQLSSAVNQAGNLLYEEGLTYVGSPYEEGVRQNAYNGVKLLQSSGFGDTGPQNQASGAQSAPAASASSAATFEYNPNGTLTPIGGK